MQTYEGLATMLADDLETIIPATLPSKGFKFHEPNYKDIAPRLGATYRLGEKTVVRAGFGIYYNPNQMNSFTFLTNNPPLAAVTTYTSGPDEPDPVVRSPDGRGRAGRAARHDLADPRSAQRAQGSVELRSAARAVAQHRARPAVRRLEHQPPRSQLLQQHADAGRPATVDPRRPSQKFRSRRMIQNDLIADYDAISVILRKRMSHGIQADAHYTWSRTRDMATHSNGGGQTMDNYDIWRDYGPAIWDIPHRFVASYLYDVPFLKDSSQRVPEVRGRRLAGLWRDHASRAVRR